MCLSNLNACRHDLHAAIEFLVYKLVERIENGSKYLLTRHLDQKILVFVIRIRYQTATNQPDQSPCWHPRTAAMEGAQDRLALRYPRRRARPPRSNEDSVAHHRAVAHPGTAAAVAATPTSRRRRTARTGRTRTPPSHPPTTAAAS